MLKKKIFYFVCAILVVIACFSIKFSDVKISNADAMSLSVTDIKNYMNIINYNRYDNDHTDPVLDSDGNVLEAYSLRDEYMIYTQNQTEWGLCWSFAANTAISTTLTLATGEYFDFSEGWMSSVFKYLGTVYPSIEGYINTNVVSLNGGKYGIGAGAIFYINDFLSRHFGVVLESDFTYHEFQTVCNENILDVYNFYNNYANTSIMENLQPGKFSLTKNELIKNSIKNHLLTHGSISAGMKWGGSNIVMTTKINNKNVVYKTSKTNSSGGHAISLIGWDDNIQIDFNHDGSITTDEHGAWIALNSWGAEWGDDGVFYVSYNDTDFKQMWGYKYIPPEDGGKLQPNNK